MTEVNEELGAYKKTTHEGVWKEQGNLAFRRVEK